MEYSPDRLELIAGGVAEALVDQGWYAGTTIFSDALTHALAHRARALAKGDALAPARVGRLEATQQNGQLRSDETQWLPDHPEDAAEIGAVAAVRTLREFLNQNLYLGTQSAELHFARYGAGAFYRTHRDRFRDDDARIVSLIFYLNDAWPAGAGGELVLYADDESSEITRIVPMAGTMVCFLSERFPHEVLPATRERFSLTGWMRRDSAMPGV